MLIARKSIFDHWSFYFLKQITMFTCSKIKCFLMYANFKSTKLIISINKNIQTKAPTQRRDIYLLANWSHKHAGRNLNVNIHADFFLYVNTVSNRELLFGIISFAPWRTLMLHVKSVQNCSKHTFPPTYNVGSACLDCISHWWLITQKPPASDLLVSLQPFEFMFLFCFVFFVLYHHCLSEWGSGVQWRAEAISVGT